MSNIRLKKIIAREFLFAVICIIISASFYLFTYINQYNEIKSKTELSKKLSGDFLEKLKIQKEFTSKFIEVNSVNVVVDSAVTSFDFYMVNKNTWKNLCRIANSDSVSNRWENKWRKNGNTDILKKIGFKNSKAFHQFISQNCIKMDEFKNYSKADVLNKEISLMNLELKDKSKNVGIKAFCISLIFLFFTRYFYYAIKWSVITLKTK